MSFFLGFGGSNLRKIKAKLHKPTIGAGVSTFSSFLKRKGSNSANSSSTDVDVFDGLATFSLNCGK